MADEQSAPEAVADIHEAPLSPDTRHAPPRLRLLINGATLVVLLSVLVATAPWWAGAAQTWWRQIFPSPPYTGSLLFTNDGVSLEARATTDGHIVWQAGGIQPNSVFFRDGQVLSIIPAGQHHLIALRVSDGHQLWGQTISPADSYTPVGSHHGILYIATRQNGGAAGTVYSYNEQTGKPGSTIPNVTFVTLDTSAQVLSYCQEMGNNHQITLENLDTQQLLWQQVLPGINCHMNIRGDLVIDEAVVLSTHLTHFVALNLQTGAIRWETAAAGAIGSLSDATIIVESNFAGDPSVPDTFTAIDVTSGGHLWSMTRQGANIPVLISFPSTELGTIVLNSPHTTLDTSLLIDINERTGMPLWTQTVQAQADDPQSWLAAIDATTLYYADRSQFSAIDLKTGNYRWDISGPAIVPTSLMVQPEALYAITSSLLSAYNMQTGIRQWHQNVAATVQLCNQCDVGNQT